MAYQLIRPGLQQGFVAASTVLPNTPVRKAGTSALFVLPVASLNELPAGVVLATAGASGLNQGEVVAVYEELNVVEAIAGASMGVDCEVVIGSSNGALIPLNTASVFSASGHYSVGRSQTAAAAGEYFSLFIKPRKV